MKKIFRNLIVLVFVVFLVAVIMIMLNGSNKLINNPFSREKYYDVKEGSLNNIKLDRAFLFYDDVAVVLKDGRYGYISKDGKMLTEFKYDTASQFTNGYGRVSINGKSDAVDKEGKELFGFKYDDLIPLSENSFLVALDGKCGIVNNEGNEITPLTYEAPVGIDRESYTVLIQNQDYHGYSVFDKSGTKKGEIHQYICKSIGDDLITAQNEDGLFGYVDLEGNTIIDFKYLSSTTFTYDRAIVTDSEGVHIIDKTGNIICTLEEDYLDIEVLENGLIKVLTNDGIGLLNSSGDVIVEPTYDEISTFYDGKAKVKKDDLYGFIGEDGTVVIPVKYENASSYSDGLASIEEDGIWRIIDSTGKPINNYLYEYYYISAVTCDRFLVFDNNENYGYLDIEGNLVIGSMVNKEPAYSDITSTCAENLYNVLEQDHFYLIDGDGKKVNDDYYDSNVIFFNSDYATICKDGKYGVINKNGEIVIDAKYENIETISDTNEYIIYSENEKYGVLDITGNVKIEPTYDDLLGPFVGNYFIAKKDSKFGVIDILGGEVIPFEYDAIKPFYNLDAIPVFKDGKNSLINRSNQAIVPDGTYESYYTTLNGDRIIVKKNDMTGVIDDKGKVIIPLTYFDIKTNGYDRNEDGSNLFFVSDQIAYAYFDNNGKNLTTFKYETGKTYTNGMAAVSINDKWGYIDQTGKEVIPCQYDYATDFNKEGYAIVANVGDGYIDTKVIDKTGATMSELRKFDMALSVDNNRIIVTKDSVYGLVDFAGNTIFGDLD